MADVEVVCQHVERGGRELFGDQDNGAHQFASWRVAVAPRS